MAFSLRGVMQIIAESNNVPLNAFNFIRKKITHNHCVINTEKQSSMKLRFSIAF